MGSAPLTAIAGAEPKGNAAQSSTAPPSAGYSASSSISAQTGEAHCPPVPSCSSKPTRLPESSSAASWRRSVTRSRPSPTPTKRSRASPSISWSSSTSSRGPRSAFDICREIRGTPALARIPVLCVGQSDDVEDRIRFLEAGADDVMAKPFDARELEARVEALLLRFQRSKDMTVVSSDGLTVVPGPADRRRSQPAGRRRHDDDRHEHRDGHGPPAAGPGRPRRHAPPVRPGGDPPQPRGQAVDRGRRSRRRGDARAGAAPDVRHPARQRAPRPGGPDLAGARRARHGRTRRSDPDDAPRVVRLGRHRCRLVARRADDDGLRARRDRDLRGLSRDRRAQGDPRPARLPERGRIGRRRSRRSC